MYVTILATGPCSKRWLSAGQPSANGSVFCSLTRVGNRFVNGEGATFARGSGIAGSHDAKRNRIDDTVAQAMVSEYDGETGRWTDPMR